MQEGKPHVRRAVQAYPCLAKTSAWFAARVSVRALCAHFLPIVASSSPFPSRTGRSLPATPAARTPPGAQALAPLPVCNTQMVFVNIDPSEGDPQAELKCSLLARLPANAADLDIPRLMQRARITCMNEARYMSILIIYRLRTAYAGKKRAGRQGERQSQLVASPSAAPHPRRSPLRADGCISLHAPGRHSSLRLRPTPGENRQATPLTAVTSTVLVDR